MNEFDLAAWIADGKAVNQQAARMFGSLNASQLNWRADPKSWSIAQCLDHLIVSNTAYFSMFRKLIESTYEPSFWAKVSPLSGFIGRWFAENLGPVVKTKMNAPPAFRPAQSSIRPNIVSDFINHNDQLLGMIAKLERVPMDTILTSPAMGLITYSLEHCIQLLIRHEQRHLQQAIRVLEQENFPRSN